MFDPIKKVVKDRRYGLDEDIKATVVQWYQQQPRCSVWKGSVTWFISVMLALVPMEACITASLV
jgi:hypothetical protein